MISYKTSDGTSTNRGMHVDFRFTESPDRPTLSTCHIVEGLVPHLIRTFRPMPIIAVCLDDKSCLLKDEVGLETPEHRLVHLKFQAALPEFIAEKTLNSCHLNGEMLTEPRLAHAFTVFWTGHSFNRGLPHLLSAFWSQVGQAQVLQGLRRTLTSQVSLTYLLAGFRRRAETPLGLAHLFDGFRGMASANPDCVAKHPLAEFLSGLLGVGHLMFNYNILPTSRLVRRGLS